MADKIKKKSKKLLIRLVSTANTGHYYTTATSRKREGKLSIKKFDPRVRKHVIYVEKKIK